MRKTIALFILLALSLAALAWSSTSHSSEKASIAAVAQNYMDALLHCRCGSDAQGIAS